MVRARSDMPDTVFLQLLLEAVGIPGQADPRFRSKATPYSD
jgi:hypothetical protein